MLKPRLILSSCLNLEKTRYDGKLIELPLVRKFQKFCEIISVCPEVGIGLPVPREKIILLKRNGGIYAVKIFTGEDLTEKLILFSKNFIQNLPEIEGIFLKSKSPSCGVSFKTKVYKDVEGKEILDYEQGIFAKEILKIFPFLPIVDEEILKDKDNLENFLIRIFVLRKFRAFKEEAQKKDDIIFFHKKMEWLLLCYDEPKTKEIERILLYEKSKFLEVLQFYENNFKQILSNSLKRETIGQVILSVLEKEKRKKIQFLIEKYQNKEIALIELLSHFKKLIKKESLKKESMQYNFEIYPEEFKDCLI